MACPWSQLFSYKYSTHWKNTGNCSHCPPPTIIMLSSERSKIGDKHSWMQAKESNRWWWIHLHFQGQICDRLTWDVWPMALGISCQKMKFSVPPNPSLKSLKWRSSHLTLTICNALHRTQLSKVILQSVERDGNLQRTPHPTLRWVPKMKAQWSSGHSLD